MRLPEKSVLAREVLIWEPGGDTMADRRYMLEMAHVLASWATCIRREAWRSLREQHGVNGVSHGAWESSPLACLREGETGCAERHHDKWPSLSWCRCHIPGGHRVVARVTESITLPSRQGYALNLARQGHAFFPDTTPTITAVTGSGWLSSETEADYTPFYRPTSGRKAWVLARSSISQSILPT